MNTQQSVGNFKKYICVHFHRTPFKNPPLIKQNLISNQIFNLSSNQFGSIQCN